MFVFLISRRPPYNNLPPKKAKPRKVNPLKEIGRWKSLEQLDFCITHLSKKNKRIIMEHMLDPTVSFRELIFGRAIFAKQTRFEALDEIPRERMEHGFREMIDAAKEIIDAFDKELNRRRAKRDKGS
jgi:hypothetical protein